MALTDNQQRTEDAGALPGPADFPLWRLGDLTLSVVRDISTIEAEWHKLERREWNSLNQSLDWCRAWTDSRNTDMIAVTGSIGAQILFILPLDITSEGIGRIARLPGGRFNNLNTGLFADGISAPSAQELATFRSSIKTILRGMADLLVIDEVPLERKGITHPLAGLASVENQNHSFQLPLFSTMEETISQLNARSRRKKFRAQVRRLEAIGGFDYVVAEGAEEQHALLDRFFQQKGTRLRAFGLPDVFEPAQTRAFLHQLLDAPRCGSDSLLAMHAIRLRGEYQGHIAAITGLSRKGRHVLCQFSSIDESISADASPGELLFWLVIENSLQNDADLFDFGIGDQPYKRSWCSRETVQHDILLPVSPLGKILAWRDILTTKAKTVVKRNHRLYAMAQRLRSRFG